MAPAPSVDLALRRMAAGLPSDAIVTDGDVRASYAKDESEAAPIVPEAVVRVGTTAEVATVLRAAHEHGVPVTARAGGTGRVGGAVPVPGGLVLAFERMAALRDIDVENAVAHVEPGLVTGQLHREVETAGLFYPPDPNSWSTCTVGGNIATNAGGPRAYKYGVTREYVLGLEAVTADGTVLKVGRETRKGVVGYDLTALLVGSEGTLALVTGATLRLLPRPECVRALAAFVPHEGDVAKVAPWLRREGVLPSCIELLDAVTLGLMAQGAGFAVPPGAGALVLLDLDGSDGESAAALERAGNVLTDHGALEVLATEGSAARERLWAPRREMSRTLRRVKAHKLSEDVVVPVTRLGTLLERVRVLADRTGLLLPAYGHAGDGNLHVNFLWDTEDEWPTVKAAIGELLREVIALGGTLSGEHGIGILKAPYLGLEQSEAVMALEARIKHAWDPQGILNPGKIFPGAARRFHGAC